MVRLSARATPPQRALVRRRGGPALVSTAPCKRCKDSRIVFDGDGAIVGCPSCPPAKAHAAPVKRPHWTDLQPHASHVFDDTGYCRGCMGHREWALVRESCSMRYRPPMGKLGPKPGDDDDDE